MRVLDENDYNSDEEIDKKKHSRLLNEVSQLDHHRVLKNPARTEATTHVSEFNLIKSAKQSINLNDLTKTLKVKSKHAAISNKIKSAQKASTLLRKPLEKPEAERIRRTVGFKKTKSDLNKWNSIVEKNRVAAQISYPLNQGEIDFIDEQKNGQPIKRYKSELDMELEKLDPPQSETIHVVTEEKFPLSMDEIVQRRKEIAKLRAHQSYQEAKAHKKNKIKSKTYHRIKRKEKLRHQIKEFEMLQKTDPQEALRKLEQLEKTRVEERMSLRHRSTGAWAKNKQIRAKYDKDSRQALAQQLTLSRELTQKLKADSSDSENEDAAHVEDDPTNPWLAKTKTTEVGDFISGYRKYWEEKNNQNKTKETIKHCNSSWTVTSTNNNDVNNLFDSLEDAVRAKSEQKLTKLQETLKPFKKKQPKTNSSYKDIVEKSDLIFQRERELRPDLDEELKNMEVEVEAETETDKILKIINQQPLDIIKKKPDDVDPNKYIEPKITNLQTKIPDISYNDDNEHSDSDSNFNTEQKNIIQEAFADDDIISDFTKEKSNIINENQMKDVNLTLPGWGAWGGKHLKPSKRKQKRFIIKMPKDVPRRDQNNGHLIINEHKSKQIKKHQVSEIPFPFTSVRDFEASIRAPIGDTFVPQTAYRRLIKPPVVTKKGAIIEPMTDDVLVRQKFTKNGFMINK